MRLWNPFAFNIDGTPSLPEAPPSLRVYGGQLQDAQLRLAQNRFHVFCQSARVSSVTNPTEKGVLSDGTPYKITRIGAQTIMQIWLGESGTSREDGGYNCEPPSQITVAFDPPVGYAIGGGLNLGTSPELGYRAYTASGRDETAVSPTQTNFNYWVIPDPNAGALIGENAGGELRTTVYSSGGSAAVGRQTVASVNGTRTITPYEATISWTRTEAGHTYSYSGVMLNYRHVYQNYVVGEWNEDGLLSKLYSLNGTALSDTSAGHGSDGVSYVRGPSPDAQDNPPATYSITKTLIADLAEIQPQIDSVNAMLQGQYQSELSSYNALLQRQAALSDERTALTAMECSNEYRSRRRSFETDLKILIRDVMVYKNRQIQRQQEAALL